MRNRARPVALALACASHDAAEARRHGAGDNQRPPASGALEAVSQHADRRRAHGNAPASPGAARGTWCA
jgi:hypothetical protein